MCQDYTQTRLSTATALQLEEVFPLAPWSFGQATVPLREGAGRGGGGGGNMPEQGPTWPLGTNRGGLIGASPFTK